MRTLLTALLFFVILSCLLWGRPTYAFALTLDCRDGQYSHWESSGTLGEEELQYLDGVKPNVIIVISQPQCEIQYPAHTAKFNFLSSNENYYTCGKTRAPPKKHGVIENIDTYVLLINRLNGQARLTLEGNYRSRIRKTKTESYIYVKNTNGSITWSCEKAKKLF